MSTAANPLSTGNPMSSLAAMMPSISPTQKPLFQWRRPEQRELTSSPPTTHQRPWEKPIVKQPSSKSPSRANSIYSTFKDDMQKMNERTYCRANGVKVCKVSRVNTSLHC